MSVARQRGPRERRWAPVGFAGSSPPGDRRWHGFPLWALQVTYLGDKVTPVPSSALLLPPPHYHVGVRLPTSSPSILPASWALSTTALHRVLDMHLPHPGLPLSLPDSDGAELCDLFCSWSGATDQDFRPTLKSKKKLLCAEPTSWDLWWLALPSQGHLLLKALV